MSNTLHAFDYLAAPASHVPPLGICAVFGDELFLRRLVLAAVRRTMLGDEQDVPIAMFDGPDADWRDVNDELRTVSLFPSGPRLAIIDDADKFVSQHREQLEEYVAPPVGRDSARGQPPRGGGQQPTGVLVLAVEQWPANTRLFKAVDKSGLAIECRVPQVQRGKNKVLDEKRLLKWLTTWAKQTHKIKLEAAAAEELLEIVGPELGLLDGELAKLALYVNEGGTVGSDLVRDVVAGWRTKSVWEIADAAADGHASLAMAGIDRLLTMGEAPQALFAQLAWSLRRYAAATRIYQQAERKGRKMSLAQAVEQAGFRPFEIRNAEGRLKQLTRHRAGELYRWLLQLDLSLKGTHSQPDRARFALEKFLVRLSQPAAKIDVTLYA